MKTIKYFFIVEMLLKRIFSMNGISPNYWKYLMGNCII